MGTSLKVMPFAGLVSRVKPSTPRLLINLEVSNDAGFEFENGRDVFYEGTTDDGVELL